VEKPLQEQESMLELKGVTIDFGGLRALNEVDLNICQGEIFGIIGPNGSGKSTLFNVTTGFLIPRAGQVAYRGRSITGWKPHRIAALGIGRVFQSNSFFPNLSVKENLVKSGFMRLTTGFLGSFFNTGRFRREMWELEEKAIELSRFVGLEKRVDILAKNLPYGEQRILEIAIALGPDPDLLFLDEPVTGMNPTETASVMELIRSIQKGGRTIVIVEHNMRVVMGICSRIAVINFGTKIAEGNPEEIAHNDEVISVYLGTRKVGAAR
jgi:branched-chain amino acid transport system ATP-binding protein